MRRVHLIVLSYRVLKYISYCTITLLLILSIIANRHIFLKTSKPSTKAEEGLDRGRVAIVIDDFGFNGKGTKEMLEIGIPITCAILPFSEFTKQEAELIHSIGHEIIIHIPMEPHHGDPSWLGEKGITSRLSNERIDEIMREAIEKVPYAVGVNNHMGSKATEDRRIMEVIIKVLQEKDLFILDSKTGLHSVVGEVAAVYKVPYIERSLFLDNTKDKTYIKKQLRKLGELALKDGTAIAIGHVGPEGGTVTVNAIKEMISELENMDIEFVYLSDLIKR